MNFYDSSVVEKILLDRGLTLAQSPEKADVIIVNTCSVRNHAEERAWGTIGSLKRTKNTNPNLKIVVMGCMAERLGKEIIVRAPHVNLVLGTHHLKDIEQLFTQDVIEGRLIVKTGELKTPYRNLQGLVHNSVVEYITAMKGCNSFCSYCVVPYTRGREESRPIKEIVEEVKKFVEKQDKEILLLGQNITAYGKDLNLKNGFLKLLEAVNEIDGVVRVRYLTSHPKDLNDEIIEGLKYFSKVPEHIHLPIQSGDDEVLKAMNRGYSTSDYLKLVEKFRRELPKSSITTDVIVGFPTETESSFINTLNFFKKIEFDNAFVAIYSPRVEALASRLYSDEIPLKEKKNRLQTLNKLQEDITYKINQKLLGTTEEIFVEEFSEKHQTYSGRTRTNKIVVFKSSKNNLIGKLVRVNIQEAGSWVIKGVEVD